MSDDIRKQQRCYTDIGESKAEMAAMVGEWGITMASGNLMTRLNYAWELRRADCTESHDDAEKSWNANIARIARRAP